MTVEHALLCKTSGLVHIRHDDVADEWRHLCGTALSPYRVEHEPRIFSCVSRRARNAAGASASDSSTPTADAPHPPAATEERGVLIEEDIAVRRTANGLGESFFVFF